MTNRLSDEKPISTFAITRRPRNPHLLHARTTHIFCKPTQSASSALPASSVLPASPAYIAGIASIAGIAGIAYIAGAIRTVCSACAIQYANITGRCGHGCSQNQFAP